MNVPQAALVLDGILSGNCEIYTAKLDRKDQYKVFAVQGDTLCDVTSHVALMAHERLYADGGIRGSVKRIEGIIELVSEDLGYSPNFTLVELN